MPLTNSFDIIFSDPPNKLELLSINKNHAGIETVTINIFRNHSFEYLESTLNSYLSFSGLNAKFWYSHYNDNFFFKEAPPAALNIIWLDLSRYKNIDKKQFVTMVANNIRSLNNSPILIIHFDNQDIKLDLNDIKDCYAVSLNKEFNIEDLIDTRYSKQFGTSISSKSSTKIAKILGLKYIPSVLLTPIKAIFLDLDNTLYSGVLGEDGPNGINITKIHKLIYKKLINLKKQGILLCILSKNNEVDFLNLPKENLNFLLSDKYITLYEVNWNKKSLNILKMIKKLNISLTDVLFIDDNIGEIEDVVKHCHGINHILAKSPEILLSILEYYPRLLKWSVNYEDKIRSQDLQARSLRKSSIFNSDNYLKELDTTLKFYTNNIAHINRISELLKKTNQFIFNYKRYSITDIINLIKKPKYLLISVSLEDKLSESGIISIIIFKVLNGLLYLDDWVISCRALGRGLEDYIFHQAFILAKQKFNLQELIIEFIIGERNEPSRLWLMDYNQKINDRIVLSYDNIKKKNLKDMIIKVINK